MTNEFKIIALLGRNEDPHVSNLMTSLNDYLKNKNIEVIVTSEISSQLKARKVKEKNISVEADLIIAIGGDGTMLYAAHLAQYNHTPLLGINRGRLGFLADITPNDMLESLDKILKGDYASEKRLLLNAKIIKANDSSQNALALNDVVIQRRDTGRMLDFKTYISGRYVNTHSGDGLIVTTPTGSTAYSLSCGGPIIDPMHDAIAIVPICPHTLNDRPIVIPANQKIEIKLLERANCNAEVIVDGHRITDLNMKDTLSIEKSKKTITLIHPPTYDFYEILHSKLHWGRDNRSQNKEGKK